MPPSQITLLTRNSSATRFQGSEPKSGTSLAWLFYTGMKHPTGKDTSNKLIKQQYGPCAQHLGLRELSDEELRQRELEWLLAFDEPPFGIFDTPHSSEAGDYEPAAKTQTPVDR